MTALPFSLDRTINIEARRETVFGFFTDDVRWAKWWGTGSTIEPRVGGRVYIKHPGNVEVTGEVLEISPPGKLVFTYGYVSGTPFGPGESRVTILLEPHGTSTQLSLHHDLPGEAARDQHVQGWRYQLALFANVVANELHSNAASLADAWFELWANADATLRALTLGDICSADICFRDRYSLNAGADDLLAHIAATQRFMPGIRMNRVGEVRHCQGTMLADWVATGPDGKVRVTGVNVFVLNGDGKIASVTGMANPVAP